MWKNPLNQKPAFLSLSYLVFAYISECIECYFPLNKMVFFLLLRRRNKALLYSNKARIMRMCAQAYGNSTRPSDEANRGQFIQPERIYFSKVLKYFFQLYLIDLYGPAPCVTYQHGVFSGSNHCGFHF